MLRNKSLLFAAIITVIVIGGCDRSKTPTSPLISTTLSHGGSLAKPSQALQPLQPPQDPEVQITFSATLAYQNTRNYSANDGGYSSLYGPETIVLSGWPGIISQAYINSTMYDIYEIAAPLSLSASYKWYIRYISFFSDDFNSTGANPYVYSPGSTLRIDLPTGWGPEVSLGQVISLEPNFKLFLRANVAYIGTNAGGGGTPRWVPANPLTTPMTGHVSYVFYDVIQNEIRFNTSVGPQTTTINLRDFSEAYRQDSGPHYWDGDPINVVISTEPGVLNYPLATGPVNVTSLTSGFTVDTNNVTFDFGNAQIIVSFTVSTTGGPIDP